MAAALAACATPTVAALRAFHPGEAWNDTAGNVINAHGGGILHYNGWYYWFGEDKIAGPLGNTAQVGVHVYASRDLYNWTDRGVALKVSNDPRSPIHKGCILERPKALYNARTRRFVMWFHLELNNKQKPGYSAALAGVAVAEEPTGPYRFLRATRLEAGVWPLAPGSGGRLKRLRGAMNSDPKFLERDFRGGQMSRDMTLFDAPDGQAWLISSSEENRYLHFYELNKDYTGLTRRWTRFHADKFEHDNEAPALFFRGGNYYLITSGTTGWAPNPARCFRSPSMWGPWKYLGNPCRGVTRQVDTTFDSQSTFVLAAPGSHNKFIFMADRWRPENPIDGRYVWLPIQWEKGKPILRWQKSWTLRGWPKPNGR